MTRRICRTCLFYEPATQPSDEALGECHKRPPEANKAEGFRAYFPLTYPADWCGGWHISAEYQQAIDARNYQKIDRITGDAT